MNSVAILFMLYAIKQQKIPYKETACTASRTIYVDLPDRIHALATEIEIQITLEVGQEFISLEAVFGNRRLTKVAKLQLSGFIMGTTSFLEPQRACISLIEEAWDSLQPK